MNHGTHTEVTKISEKNIKTHYTDSKTLSYHEISFID